MSNPLNESVFWATSAEWARDPPTGMKTRHRLHVRGVIEDHVSILGCKREFFGSFLFLSKNSQCSGDRYGEQTRNENTLVQECTNFSCLARAAFE